MANAFFRISYKGHSETLVHIQIFSRRTPVHFILIQFPFAHIPLKLSKILKSQLPIQSQILLCTRTFDLGSFLRSFHVRYTYKTQINNPFMSLL